MPTTEFDYLIVGQGLAGSILAHTLITRGHRVMVIDNDHVGSSSKVAAGIMNPITGPRLSKDKSFDAFFCHAKNYYAKLEYHIKTPVLSMIKQTRQLKDQRQLDYLKKRLTDPRYDNSIKEHDSAQLSSFTSLGMPEVDILGTAIIDTKALLQTTKAWLVSLSSYTKTKFDYTKLVINNQSIRYEGIQANNVIFCEGYQAIKNPWLKELPFKLAKGEILSISDPLINDTMLSWDKWLTPAPRSQGNRYNLQNTSSAKLGSNFDWDDLNLTPKNSVKEALLTSLKENTRLINPKITKHEVGIRPSTRQREPFIGPLSNVGNAYCFNGFGSKGCLLIPYYADLLADHLDNKTPLPTKVAQWL